MIFCKPVVDYTSKYWEHLGKILSGAFPELYLLNNIMRDVKAGNLSDDEGAELCLVLISSKEPKKTCNSFNPQSSEALIHTTFTFHFDTKMDVKTFKSQIETILTTYGVVSLADISDILKDEDVSFIRDPLIGWLKDSLIIRESSTSDGKFSVTLSKPHHLP